jgi:hypothetical protein
MANVAPSGQRFLWQLVRGPVHWVTLLFYIVVKQQVDYPDSSLIVQDSH